MLPKGLSCRTDFATYAALHSTGGHMARLYVIVHVPLALGRVTAVCALEAKSLRILRHLGLDQIIQLFKIA